MLCQLRRGCVTLDFFWIMIPVGQIVLTFFAINVASQHAHIRTLQRIELRRLFSHFLATTMTEALYLFDIFLEGDIQVQRTFIKLQ